MTKEKKHRAERHRQSTSTFFRGWVTLYWLKVPVMLDFQEGPLSVSPYPKAFELLLKFNEI